MRRQGETFKADPLTRENSWRVIGSWGTLEAFRVTQSDAERIAADLNALPEESASPQIVCVGCGCHPVSSFNPPVCAECAAVVGHHTTR